MVANKPGTPGRARSSRKAIAQGVPVVPASPDYLVGIFLFAHETSGCGQRPVLPAPSVLRGPTNCKTRTRNRAAGTVLYAFSAVMPPAPGYAKASAGSGDGTEIVV